MTIQSEEVSIHIIEHNIRNLSNEELRIFYSIFELDEMSYSGIEKLYVKEENTIVRNYIQNLSDMTGIESYKIYEIIATIEKDIDFTFSTCIIFHNPYIFIKREYT